MHTLLMADLPHPITVVTIALIYFVFGFAAGAGTVIFGANQPNELCMQVARMGGKALSLW